MEENGKIRQRRTRFVTKTPRPLSKATRQLVALLGAMCCALGTGSVVAQELEPASSAGCGRGLYTPGTHHFSVLHQGLNRTYQVHIPEIYDDSAPTSVLLNLHPLRSVAPPITSSPSAPARPSKPKKRASS